ncbi:hypothetical protein E4U41_006693 [Claviceps citrina]|nr:hypothetical protein E4U41_006693 [Claviceps citrina]
MLKDHGYSFFGQNFEPDPEAAQKASQTATQESLAGIASSKENASLVQEEEGGNFQHKMYLFLMDGKLGHAPVGEPRSVLEIATGTGIWAREYATAHPSCRVTGTDLSAMQPPHSLPNLTFVQQDAETEAWPSSGAGPGGYDYIHLRYTVSCFHSTPSVIRRAWENLAPGGWIEFFDPHHVYLPVDQPLAGTAVDRWASLVNEAARSVGRDLGKAGRYAQWLREAGFVNVTEEKVGLPCSAWTKDERLKKLGALVMEDEVALVTSLGKLLRLVVKDEGEARAIEEGARGDLRNLDLHFIKVMYIVYAQKPKDA